MSGTVGGVGALEEAIGVLLVEGRTGPAILRCVVVRIAARAIAAVPLISTAACTVSRGAVNKESVVAAVCHVGAGSNTVWVVLIAIDANAAVRARFDQRWARSALGTVPLISASAVAPNDDVASYVN